MTNTNRADATITALADCIRAAGFTRMADDFEIHPGARDLTLRIVLGEMGRRENMRPFVTRLQQLSDFAMQAQRATGTAAMKRYIGRER